MKLMFIFNQPPFAQVDYLLIAQVIAAPVYAFVLWLPPRWHVSGKPKIVK